MGKSIRQIWVNVIVPSVSRPEATNVQQVRSNDAESDKLRYLTD